MKTACLPPRLFRLALRLAFVAVLAQLALGVTSAAHHAGMAAAPAAGWEEICTPWGVERIALAQHEGGALPEDTRTLPMLGECVLCAAAGLSALPVPAPVLAAADISRAATPPPAPAAHPGRAPSLRPPVRAPPRLS